MFWNAQIYEFDIESRWASKGTFKTFMKSYIPSFASNCFFSKHSLTIDKHWRGEVDFDITEIKTKRIQISFKPCYTTERQILKNNFFCRRSFEISKKEKVEHNSPLDSDRNNCRNDCQKSHICDQTSIDSSIKSLKRNSCTRKQITYLLC